MRLVGLEILTDGVKVLHYGQVDIYSFVLKNKSYKGKKLLYKIKH